MVGKDELFELVWPGLAIEPNNLQVQVWALRRLLGHHAIATVARRGYRFTPRIDLLAMADADAAPPSVDLPPQEQIARTELAGDAAIAPPPSSSDSPRRLRWRPRGSRAQ